MAAMRAQVSELEATYETLYAQRVERQQQLAHRQSDTLSLETLLEHDDDNDDDTMAPTSQLRQQYAAARAEMTALRHQIDATKKKLSDFDLFTASLECYLSEFQPPPPTSSSSVSSGSSSPASVKSHASSPPTTPSERSAPPLQPLGTLRSPLVAQLTDAVCQEIIRECYQEIISRTWSGRAVSSGAEMLGWSDQRFVDGPTLQFALAKSFPALGQEYLMEKTWEILTTARHMRTLQRSTLEVTVLQRVSDDIILLERRARHKQLHRIACVHLLVFRIRTERGYIIAFKAMNPPGSPQESSASATALSSQWSDGDDDDGDTKDDKRAETRDGSRATSSSASPQASKTPRSKPKLAWVDTMQWFRFDALDDSDASGSRGTRVTIAGRTANCDASYAQFFLFEVVTFVVRWESAVAGARLLHA